MTLFDFVMLLPKSSSVGFEKSESGTVEVSFAKTGSYYEGIQYFNTLSELEKFLISNNEVEQRKEAVKNLNLLLEDKSKPVKVDVDRELLEQITQWIDETVV